MKKYFLLQFWNKEARPTNPGRKTAKHKIYENITTHIPQTKRAGNVWITDDGDEPGTECEYINVSYFPEAEKVCLFNIDFGQPHTFFLHAFGKCEMVELGPGEFRMIAR